MQGNIPYTVSRTNAASSRLSFVVCSFILMWHKNEKQNLKCKIKHLVCQSILSRLRGFCVCVRKVVGAAALRSLDFKVGQF